VVTHFSRGNAAFNDNRIYKEALAQIAPLCHLPVEWPPNRVAFNDEWLETLSTSVSG